MFETICQSHPLYPLEFPPGFILLCFKGEEKNRFSTTFLSRSYFPIEIQVKQIVAEKSKEIKGLAFSLPQKEVRYAPL